MAYFAAVTGAGSTRAPSVTGNPPVWAAPERLDGEHVHPPEPFASVFDRTAPAWPDDPVDAPSPVPDRSTNHDRTPPTAAERTPRIDALPLVDSPPAPPVDAGGERPPVDVTARPSTTFPSPPHRPVVTVDVPPRSSPSPVGDDPPRPSRPIVADPAAEPPAPRRPSTSSTPRVRADATSVGSARTPPVERRGEVRVASTRVPRHVRRRELDVRRWLQSAPEVLDVSTDSRATVHIDRVIVESPQSPAEPSAPPRERPVAKGFSDYDSIRRR